MIKMAQITQKQGLRGIISNPMEFILLLVLFIYIVSPIDLLSLNPVDDIVAVIIILLILFPIVGITR